MADLDLSLAGRMSVAGFFIQFYLFIICLAKCKNMKLIKIIIFNTLEMEIKRNSASNNVQFNAKTNNLMQPLISISKASTPVRTRIIGSNSHLNSTPINFSKAPIAANKSPNNKENHQGNHIKIESSMKTFTVPSEPQNRINLSPIISLNRKISEGPKFLEKKTHTPENHKVLQEYECNMVNSGRIGNQKRYQTLTASNPVFVPNNNIQHFSNLRGSNSFKNLIEGRCKTPNKYESSSTGLFAIKRQSVPLLKQSSSTNLLFKTYNNQESKFESSLKMAQSRSYDRLKTFSSANSQQNEIKCMNNDGKKAKYRVLNNDDPNQEGQRSEIELYYCSKCTIPLVQQGFIVEQISKESMRQQMGDNGKMLSELRQRLQNKKKGCQLWVSQLKQKEEQQMGELQVYYNRVFQYLQSQRDKDIEAITSYYNQKKIQSKNYIKEIDNRIFQVQNKSVHPTKILNDHSLEQFINSNEHQQITNYQLEINSTLLFNKFIDNYRVNLQINLESSTKLIKNNDIGSRNHAMRFSFEKLLSDINYKKGQTKSYMNPLQQEDEEQNQHEDENDVVTQHTAFRDLFPADQEESNHMNNDMTSPTFKKI